MILASYIGVALAMPRPDPGEYDVGLRVERFSSSPQLQTAYCARARVYAQGRQVASLPYGGDCLSADQPLVFQEVRFPVFLGQGHVEVTFQVDVYERKTLIDDTGTTFEFVGADPVGTLRTQTNRWPYGLLWPENTHRDVLTTRGRIENDTLHLSFTYYAYRAKP